MAAAILAICLGALLSAWAWTATTNTHEILAARHTIERGEIISADDLARVRVSHDPALKSLPATEFSQVVGKRAALDIARGGMLTPDSVTAAPMPAMGYSVVGIALKPEQAPGIDLSNGDKVRVVVTPAAEEGAERRAPFVNNATVVGVHNSEETGLRVVDLLVSKSEAAVLATRIASGNVALVLDSREH